MGISFNTGGPAVSDEEATMEFFDADGKKVDQSKAVVQYLSNDPNKPEPKRAKTAPDETKASTKPTETTETK